MSHKNTDATDKIEQELFEFCHLIGLGHSDFAEQRKKLAGHIEKVHAAGLREGIERATTPTDAMKTHFEGDNEIYQTFEIDGETHILPLRFATVRYVLDEIRALIKDTE